MWTQKVVTSTCVAKTILDLSSTVEFIAIHYRPCSVTALSAIVVQVNQNWLFETVLLAKLSIKPSAARRNGAELIYISEIHLQNKTTVTFWTSDGSFKPKILPQIISSCYHSTI